ncbi:MAG TPA: putative quinol monooxygenase [Novosphingobium sp.]|nr:putative quinol monooxygenase [Novosphingobium sp.]
MLLIALTVRVPAENIEKARAAAATMIAATRLEDGCLSYAFAQDLLDPGLIHISETWRDGAALKAHGASAHMAAWREAAGGLGLGERDFKVYKTDEGTPL